MRINRGMPGHSRSFRLSDQAIRRMERLVRMLNTSRNDVVEIAVSHLLATVEKDEPVYLRVPSEPMPEGEADDR